MRKVTVATFLSLDGVMQAPGGPDEDVTGGFRFGGWQAPFADEMVGAAVMETMTTPFDLLLGRRTYEIFSAYWPYYDDQPHNAIARAFNDATKYVASSGSPPLPWRNSVLMRDPAAEVAKLKQADGPDLRIWGSGRLVQTLLDHGLIDRMTVLIYPLLLGRGKRLFDGVKPGALKVASSRTTPQGVVINTYAPDGPVRTGRVGGEENPSPAELARRERWAREG